MSFHIIHIFFYLLYSQDLILLLTSVYTILGQGGRNKSFLEEYLLNQYSIKNYLFCTFIKYLLNQYLYKKLFTLCFYNVVGIL